MTDMLYMRVLTGPDGESHWEDVAVARIHVQYVCTTAPPVALSDWRSAARVAFLSFPPGWRGEPHPTP